jgi:hypothetical protein
VEYTAIIGGVLGGLALIILLILLLIYLRRKHDQANGGFNDGGSVYSGWTEKTRRDHAMGIGGGNNNVAPPGTYCESSLFRLSMKGSMNLTTSY